MSLFAVQNPKTFGRIDQTHIMVFKDAKISSPQCPDDGVKLFTFTLITAQFIKNFSDRIDCGKYLKFTRVHLERTLNLCTIKITSIKPDD